MSFGKKKAKQAPIAAASVQQEQINKAIEEIKRQFNITQRQIKPFVQAGARALPGVEAAATVGGLEETLASIFNTDVFGSLVEERGRAVEGQLAAGGLTRSGTALTEAARVPTDIGLAIEALLSGRGANLATAGQNAVLGLGGLRTQQATSLSDLLVGVGQAGASGILGAQQAEAAGSQNFLNLAGTLGSAAILAFSDPDLKENAEVIGEINDLKIYQWDWIEGVKDSFVSKCQTIGFMADEVCEKYPQYVHDICGFMVINYELLLDELGAA